MEADRPRNLRRTALPSNHLKGLSPRPAVPERLRGLALKDQATWADISPGSRNTRGRAALASSVQEGIGGGI